MPRKAKDFSKALIYKLVCLDPQIKEIYVGSSTNFNQRKKHHKDSCIYITSKGYNFKVYQFIRENGGWFNWEMVLIEYYKCNTELELGRRENFWKQELKAQLNTRTPHIYENKKEADKAYIEANREQIAEQRAEYRESNKEKIAEQNKKYKEKNKEQLAEKWKKKITCVCGCMVRRDGLAAHKKSAKHITMLASI